MIRRITHTPYATLFSLVLFGAAVVVAWHYAPPTKTRATPTPAVHRKGIIAPYYLGSVPCGYFPHADMFGYRVSHVCVSSLYLYEQNLLDGSAPVADMDYVAGNAVQTTLQLPGTPWDHYYYRGALYVQGSGWISKWVTPNGGHFAIAHMWNVYQPYSTMAYVPGPGPEPTQAATPGTPLPARLGSGDDMAMTAKAVGSLPSMPVDGVRPYYPGGAALGQSHWPEWAQYGNGLAGPANAQICVIVDAAALNWFWRVQAGRDYHKPRPRAYHFDYKHWYRWADGHHKKRSSVQSPWRRSRKRCTGKGCLGWSTSVWLAHKRGCAGVRGREHWHTPRGGYGYNQLRFSHCVIRTWPRLHASKVSRR